MPRRPYEVLHADLPFYSDQAGTLEVTGARLVVLKCRDSKQLHQPVECMPVRRNYRTGQIVNWDLDNKKMWDQAWYRDPDTGEIDRAWAQAVEFIGQVVQEP